MTAEETLTAAPDSARKIIVAIDGPAGAGKSTIARHLARHFGLLNLETGAMYRAFALKALRSAVALDDAKALEELTHETEIRLDPGEEENLVLLDGEDVTGQIRNPLVTEAASRVSVFPAVRAWLVRLQQQIGARGGVVMEGRDIGTVVFPHAPVKIFLDASPEKRGERRYEQNRAGDQDVQQTGATAVATQLPTKVLEEIRERDRRDRTRADSPLRPAADATIIDSTDLTLEQVIERAAALVEAYLRASTL
jgi:CMP/dCMP kinase